jgi:hypothetical protein
MNRRRITDAEGASMDSLMDTLTNVVGILIVILVLAQINGAQQVRVLLENLVPASPEEMSALTERRERALALRAEEQRLLEEWRTRRAEQEVAAQAARLEIAVLERRLAERTTVERERAELTRQIEEEKRRLEQARRDLDTLLAEREKLEAQLATTPVPGPPAAKVVRLPAARPIPPQAVIERFFVTGGRIHHLAAPQVLRQVSTEWTQLRRNLEKETLRERGREPRVIYDQEKVVAHFRARLPKPPDVEVTLPANRPWTRLALHFKAKTGAGEPAEALDRPTARFPQLVRGFAANTVVFFHVTGDSFDAYLKARDIVDRRRLAAGWEFVSRAEYRETLSDFEVNRLEQPPPPATNAAPSVPAPKRTLD